MCLAMLPVPAAPERSRGDRLVANAIEVCCRPCVRCSNPGVAFNLPVPHRIAGRVALPVVGLCVVSAARRLSTGICPSSFRHRSLKRIRVRCRCCGSFATASLAAVPPPQSLRTWVEQLPAEFLELVSEVEAVGAGQRVWIVGGALRDALTGIVPNDVDLCTTLTPQEVLDTFPDSKGTGVQYGTVTIKYKGLRMECTTLRAESSEYSDGRRPDSVSFGTDLRQDLARRDFTINAMALDAKRLLLYDPFGGATDCAENLLRTVGDASVKLQQDALRVLRAYRYLGAMPRAAAARQPDAALDAALRASAAGLLAEGLSRERMLAEAKRILGSPSVVAVVRRMLSDGTLDVVLAGAGPKCPDAHELRALEALCSVPYDDSGIMVAAYAERSWVEVLTLLLCRTPENELEKVCKSMRLSNNDRKFVLRHTQSLSELPEAADVPSVRVFTAAMNEDLFARLRLARAWGIAQAPSAAEQAEAHKVDAITDQVLTWRRDSLKPRSLAGGRRIEERTGLARQALSRLKDRMYLEQVARNVRHVEALEALLPDFAACAAAPPRR